MKVNSDSGGKPNSVPFRSKGEQQVILKDTSDAKTLRVYFAVSAQAAQVKPSHLSGRNGTMCSGVLKQQEKCFPRKRARANLVYQIHLRDRALRLDGR
jgi:hypothetical protein